MDYTLITAIAVIGGFLVTLVGFYWRTRLKINSLEEKNKEINSEIKFLKKELRLKADKEDLQKDIDEIKRSIKDIYDLIHKYIIKK